MLKKYEIHKLIPEVKPENFCISPFQNTKQTATGRVSACAYASSAWKMPGLTAEEKWDNDQVNARRLDAINNIKTPACHRCWDEEKIGKPSLRQRQMNEYFPDDYENYIKTGLWLSGPHNASFKVSNICNLACRTCFSIDSSHFNKEGDSYATLYGATNPNTNIYMIGSPPKHINFKEYFDLVKNTTKFDFYGGEPMINTTHIEMLEHLVSIGKSKNVHLYYATNCTIPVSKKVLDLWGQFQQVGLGISIDGIGSHAEYLRWPCKWPTIEKNVNDLIKYKNEGLFTGYIMGSYTVSTLNVFQVDEMISWYNNMLGENRYFINMVTTPEHMTIRLLPDYLKNEILSRVKLDEVRNFLSVSDYSEHWWKKFIIWQKRMDLYRNQDFTQVYPELYKVIKKDWDKVTNLSESNFNNPILE